MSDNLENPEMEFEFSEETLEVIPADEIVEIDMSFGANLAAGMDTAILRDIGSQRQDALQNFKNARQQWEEKIKQGIHWLGLNTEGQGNTEVDGACLAVHPLLIENVVKFQA